MKWQNLAEFKCPCCGAPLFLEDGTTIVTCTMCKFEIESDRMEAIKKNRCNTNRKIVPHFWQNLHKGNCVLCNHPLEAKNATLLACTNEQCDFKIGRSRVEEIIANPTHSANKYKN